MTENTGSDAGRADRFEHLLSAPVRERVGESGYGSWRSFRAPDAVSLSFGFPFPASFPMDDLLRATQRLFAAEPDEALQYGGGASAEQLSETVRERSRWRGIDPDGYGVVLTNGATHAIDLIAQAFLDPGDGVFTEAPTFMGALSVFRNYGVDITGIGMDETGLDVEELESELRRRRRADESLPTVLYTIPTFQNPSGTTLPRSARTRVLELAVEYDFVVLEDDAYGDLRYDGDSVPPLAALDDTGRVLHVGTFSKTIAPGVRTGWVLADEPLADAIDGLAAGGTNVFTRGLLGQYCADGRLAANVDRLRDAYAARRDHMLACLEDHMPAGSAWTEPDGGFFVWVTLPDSLDAEALLSPAADAGVTYLPGPLFYPDGGEPDRLRLSFSHAEPAAIDRGVAALGEATRRAIEDGGE